jgi:hypothetical protein
LALICICANPTAAKPSFVVTPEPVWTTKRAEVEPRRAVGDLPSSVILDNEEIRVSAKDIERFYHRSQRADTSAGLENVSQLRFYFEPSYQKLAIHFIKIIRGKQTIDALRPSEIKVVQTEEELDDQLYNGTLVAVTFLNDIRVGDIVDYAYTVTGNNPVFGGQFAQRFSLAGREPIQTSRVRLLLPSDRVLHIRTHGANLEPKVSSLGSEKEYLWEASDVPAIDVEDSTPTWFEQAPFFTVSEFPDWQTVVQWALPLYRADEPLTPEMKVRSDAWANQFPQPEQRLVAALRFVQQDIRYQGIELGPYSHQPTPASRTLARRFGDCKDKSLLLLTILRYMGIDSAIALVNTATRHSLDEWQASPGAFDHVIVQARIGGKTYWLDPTVESQRGALAQYYDPLFDRALVLRDDSKALEVIPSPKAESPTTIIREQYKVRGYGLPVSFVVSSTYHGPDADDKRHELSKHSPAEMAKVFLNYYAESNPSIRAESPPTVQDDQDSDTIVITEKYIVDSFWKDQYHYFSADLTYAELPKPDISKRSQPLAISYPTFITQDIEIDLPAPPELSPQSDVIADDAFRFEYSHRQNANAVNLSYSLKTFQDHVSPDKVPACLAQVDRIRNSTGLQLPQGSDTLVRTNPESQGPGKLQVLAILFSVAVIVAAIVLVKVRRKREEKQRAFSIKPTLGGAPETAVRCKDPMDIEAFARRFKCACGNFPFKPDVLTRQEFLFYDGERLATLKLKCDACGRANDLYFVKPDTQSVGDGPGGSTVDAV